MAGQFTDERNLMTTLDVLIRIIFGERIGTGMVEVPA